MNSALFCKYHWGTSSIDLYGRYTTIPWLRNTFPDKQTLLYFSRLASRMNAVFQKDKKKKKAVPHITLPELHDIKKALLSSGRHTSEHFWDKIIYRIILVDS